MAMQDDDDDQNRPTPTSPRPKEMAPWGGEGGGQIVNDPEIAQNGEIPMEYEYDERENWDVWAAMIDAKLDAVMEHQKDHPRPQEGDGEVLMDHVEKRVESALVDYKK